MATRQQTEQRTPARLSRTALSLHRPGVGDRAKSALAAGRYLGRGDGRAADEAASVAMAEAIEEMPLSAAGS